MSSALEFREGQLDDPVIGAFLAEHLSALVDLTPECSGHALDLEALRRPEVTFWSVWIDGDLVGCGALKELDPGHAEIKSMRTAPNRVRQGIASSLLEYMLGAARERSYSRISLETGSSEAFEPARALYRRFGFVPCAPFGDYVLDPFSYCMSLDFDP